MRQTQSEFEAEQDEQEFDALARSASKDAKRARLKMEAKDKLLSEVLSLEGEYDDLIRPIRGGASWGRRSALKYTGINVKLAALKARIAEANK